MKCILSVLAVLTIFNCSFACLNEMRKNARGQEVESELFHYHFREYSIDPDNKEYLAKLKTLDSLWRTDHTIYDYSDYGVTLVYLGRFEEARDVFIEIEKLQPGRHATAANLGTVYELLGDNVNALRWIKKAVEIDPASHQNSEWIHVKILEAKIGGEHLVTSGFLLNTSFGNGEVPETKLSDNQLADLRNALNYQLQERVSLVKPQDRIVALLLFELGNIVSLTDNVNLAIEIYDKAKEYGFQAQLLEKRMKKFETLRQEIVEEAPDTIDNRYRPVIVTVSDDIETSGFLKERWLAYLAAAIVVFGSGYYVFRRRSR